MKYFVLMNVYAADLHDDPEEGVVVVGEVVNVKSAQEIDVEDDYTELITVVEIPSSVQHWSVDELQFFYDWLQADLKFIPTDVMAYARFWIDQKRKEYLKEFAREQQEEIESLDDFENFEKETARLRKILANCPSI